MGRVLHRNTKGIVMVREDFKSRSQVKVISTCEEKHYSLRTYRFALIHEPVEVPYCSWANLDCCGGWSYDEEYLDTAVQRGLKLFAGRSTHLKCAHFPKCPTAEEAKHQFEALTETLPAGVFADIDSGLDSTDVLHTYICRIGTISEYIDLDMVFGFYEKLGVHISRTEKAEVKRLCDIEIRQYGADNVPFRYTQAESRPQLISTGLLLGYPVESTVSILQGY